MLIACFLKKRSRSGASWVFLDFSSLWYIISWGTR
jgi:hypothetical protein